MLAYPYVLHSLFADPSVSLISSSEQVGALLGTSIHDTSQVLGASLTYKEVYGDEIVFQTAAVTKLTRNFFLAGVVPGLTWLSLSQAALATGTASDSDSTAKDERETAISGLATFQKYVPSFLVAFIGMASLRSYGDSSLATSGLAFNILDPILYKSSIKFLGDDVSKVCLGAAMASVGCSTDFKSLRGVGIEPFLVGGSGALVVGGTAVTISSVVM